MKKLQSITKTAIIIIVAISLLLSACITIEKTDQIAEDSDVKIGEDKIDDGTFEIKGKHAQNAEDDKNTLTGVQQIPVGDTIIKEPDYIKKGIFEDRARGTKGNAYIIEERGKLYLQLSKDFETTKIENLKVLLVKKPRVFTGPEIYKGGYFSLGDLMYFEGEQRYEIPKEVDIEEYLSVAIHSFPDDLISGNARFFP